MTDGKGPKLNGISGKKHAIKKWLASFLMEIVRLLLLDNKLPRLLIFFAQKLDPEINGITIVRKNRYDR